MDWLIKSAIDRSRVVVFLWLMIVVTGIGSYFVISKEFFPDIKVPVFTITVRSRGISAQDCERLIVRPLEQRLRAVKGLQDIRCTAYEGVASIVMEFDARYDLATAKDDVNDKMEEAKIDLPSNLDEYTLKEANISEFPVLVLKLSGALSDRLLYDAAESLKEEIESKVSSVLRVGVLGKRDEVVEIELPSVFMHNYDLNLSNLQMLFSANNRMISAGVLESEVGRFPVSLNGSFVTSHDILQAPLNAHDGSTVKVGDIAKVRRTFVDPTNFARDRGDKAVVLEVVKRSGENVIDTIRAVRCVAGEFQKHMPPQMKISYAQDSSEQVFNLLHELLNHLLSAFLLVMVVIVLSLGWKSSFLVALALPGAFLSGIIYLYICGHAINMIVLFALIFAVGMLVDGSIIVVEYAARKMGEGFSPYEAYLEAALTMKWPVITSISTILVVFYPMLYWPGVMGSALKFLPITLIATLTASVVMALFFVPCFGVLFGRPKYINSHDAELENAEDITQISGITGKYVRLLDRVLNHPVEFIISVVGLLFVVGGLYFKMNSGVEFFPTMEPENSNIHIYSRGNLSTSEKDKVVREVEALVLPMQELRSVYTKSGSVREANMESNGRSSSSEDEIGAIHIEYEDWQKRRSSYEIADDIMLKCRDIAGVKISIEHESKNGGDKPICFEVIGDSFDAVLSAGSKIREFMDSLSDLTMIRDTLPVPSIEWDIQIDREEALKYGANITSIGNALQMVTRGLVIGKFRPDDSREELDILVRLPADERVVDMLRHMRIQTQSGLVSLAHFVKVQPRNNITSLTRSDGHPAVVFRADLRKGAVADHSLSRIQEFVKQQGMSNVRLVFKGDARNRQESVQFLLIAFAISLLMIILLMLIEFNSFFSTFLVLSAVVISTIGVFAGLLIKQMPFVITMGGIGIIGLAGIIVSNNIILIDTFDILRQRYSGRESILRACAQRLRPVFLTKITVILGMLPIMCGISIDFVRMNFTIGAPSGVVWEFLATCIVSGVAFASVLTLFFTPCALMVREWWRR